MCVTQMPALLNIQQFSMFDFHENMRPYDDLGLLSIKLTITLGLSFSQNFCILLLTLIT